MRVELARETFEAILRERRIRLSELHELSIVPPRNHIQRGGGFVASNQMFVFLQSFGDAGRDLGFVKPRMNLQFRNRERIIVPTDAADDRDVIGDKRFILEPMPAEGANAPREVLREN